MSDNTRRIVVLGIGNLLKGDDGAGVRAIEALERTELPDGVECVEGGTGGPMLMVEFEGADALVIVDAVDLGEPPGTVRAFGLEEVRDTDRPVRFSLHEVGVMPMLDLARQVGELPAVVRIVGIQPKTLGGGDRLSPEVEAAVRKAVDIVKEEARRLAHADAD